MMHHKKTLTLREIQKIANLIDLCKGGKNQLTGALLQNYTEKWDASSQYWMGRLRDFCDPIVTRITETRTSIVKKHGEKNDDGGYEIHNAKAETFNEEIKALLDGTETIRFPEFKASSFVKMKDKKIEESLVPMDFWQDFHKYLIMDVEEFKVPEDEPEMAVAE